MKLSDYKQDLLRHKVLVIGFPGTGKTTLVAELANKYKLWWLDCEHGAITLTKLPQAAQDNIELISLPDSASYPIAADTLVQLFKTGTAKICWEHGKNNCAVCLKNSPNDFTSIDFSKFGSNDILVLDTVTQLGASILAHITRNLNIEVKLDWDTWGVLRRQTEFIASQIQALRINFVCIAHLADTKLEDGKVKLVPQFGSSIMSGTFAKAFDDVIYCEIKNNKHMAGSATNYAANILTKSRTDFCIEDLPTPSLIPLFDGTFKPRNAATPAGNAAALLAGIKKS